MSVIRRHSFGFGCPAYCFPHLLAVLKLPFYTGGEVHMIQPYLVVELYALRSCDVAPSNAFLLLILWYLESRGINSLSLRLPVWGFLNLQLPVSIFPIAGHAAVGNREDNTQRKDCRKLEGRLWGPVPASTKTNFTLELPSYLSW